jgi:hypothetical protein
VSDQKLQTSKVDDLPTSIEMQAMLSHATTTFQLNSKWPEIEDPSPFTFGHELPTSNPGLELQSFSQLK